MSFFADRVSTMNFINNRLATIGCTLGNPEEMKRIIPKCVEEAVAVYCDHIWGLQGEYIYESKRYSPLRFFREGDVVSIYVHHG